ncbi:MAG: CBS domain-containing protein [Acidobacteriota bacterium]|jgi:CBS domain-containing protein
MLHATDIMSPKFITVPVSMTIGDLVDVLQRAHIHAAPVLSDAGELVGIVTQDDILYGTMGSDGSTSTGGAPARIRSRSGLLEIEEFAATSPQEPDLWSRPVAEIMTEPAISVGPSASVLEVCEILWSLRIHHVPVVDEGRVIGVISALDLCRAIAEGKLPI